MRATQQITLRCANLDFEHQCLLDVIIAVVVIQIIMLFCSPIWKIVWIIPKRTSTDLLFIMCFFRYHRNEKLYPFLSLPFDLLHAFSSIIKLFPCYTRNTHAIPIQPSLLIPFFYFDMYDELISERNRIFCQISQ